MSCFDNTITLFDSAFEIIGDPITTFESLSFSDAWEKHGAMTLVVGEDEWSNVKDAAWLGVCGRVYEVETIQSDDDNSTIKINGSSLNVLFDRIIITEEERLQGRLEERVRYLVDKYAITGSQRLTNLSLGVDNNYKRAMDATTKRGQKLSEFLYTAMNRRGFSFAIVLVSGALVFNVLRGVDRTQDQSVNAPVQISTRDALEKASYKKSIKDYRNFAVVCDEDQDAPQTVEVDLSHGAPVRSMYVSGRSAGADESAAVSMFVMACASGKLYTSTNGVNFTSQTTGITDSLWAADYQNGQFVVCGSNGKILTSTDGLTWTSRTSGVSVSLEGAKYVDGLYVVTGNSSAILSSYDGATWSSEFSGVQKVMAPVFAKNSFVTRSAPASWFYVYTSPSGSGDWTAHFYPMMSGYALGGILKMLTVQSNVAGVGYVQTAGGTQYPYVSISESDGATWTDYAITNLSNKRFLDCAYGNGVFVAVGQPNIIAYSYDLINWTDCTPADNIDYIAITFNGSSFYAYGYSTRKVAISSDGTSFAVSAITGVTANTDAVTYGTSTHAGTLRQIGIDALQEAAVVETLDGDINQDLAPVYETDYNNGDVVDAVDTERGISAAKRVLEVEFLIDKDNDYAIIPKLGKDFLSLRQYIAKEIRNNGV